MVRGNASAMPLQVSETGFAIDAEPYRIISGGVHDFRIHPEHWANRLRKARLIGLNTIAAARPVHLWRIRRRWTAVLAIDRKRY
jgi:beta-galactosidase